MTLALVGDTVAVVAKGIFNPGIFSPSWLYANGVIGESDYDSAQIEGITPDVAKFVCGWLDVTVTRDALQLTTSDIVEFERLRDAMVAVLQLLPHVPLAAMGINRAAHFDVGGLDAWHTVGDRLAPKDIWSSTLVLAGMKSLTIWGVRPDNHGGRIHVTVEPSSTVRFGIYIGHNDHFDLVEVEDQPTRREDFTYQEQPGFDPSLDKRPLALLVLQEEWQESLNRAYKVMERVYSAAGNRGTA